MVVGQKLSSWAARGTDDGMKIDKRLSRPGTQPEKGKGLWEHEILDGGEGKKAIFVKKATVLAKRAPVEAMASGQALFVADTSQREVLASGRAGICAATSTR